MMGRIIVMGAGMILLIFGYLICFKRKYHLINWFKEDHEAGRRDEQYARRVGMLELLGGALLLVVGIILCLW